MLDTCGLMKHTCHIYHSPDGVAVSAHLGRLLCNCSPSSRNPDWLCAHVVVLLAAATVAGLGNAGKTLAVALSCLPFVTSWLWVVDLCKLFCQTICWHLTKEMWPLWTVPTSLPVVHPCAPPPLSLVPAVSHFSFYCSPFTAMATCKWSRTAC